MKNVPALLPLPKSVMEGYHEDTVWAVRQAILNLLELVDSVVPEANPEEQEKLRAEAKKTIVLLSAAIIVTDHRYGEAEHAFILHLVDMSEPEMELSDLNDCAEVWRTASNVVPRFFSEAVCRGADIPRAMLREIQFIGNNVCISDGDFERRERVSVSEYVSFLEDFLDSKTSDLGRIPSGFPLIDRSGEGQES